MTRSILVVDDHRVLTDALVSVLAAHGDYGPVRVAHSLSEARVVLAAGGTGVDRAVVDVRLPDGDGTDLIPELLAARVGCRVLVLTAHLRPDVVARARRRGAVDVLAKGVGLSELVRALEHDPAEPNRPGDLEWRGGPPDLTPREVEVLRLVAEGHDVRRVGRRLAISEHTVRDHLKNTYAKLEVPGQVGAVVKAHRSGLIDLDGLDEP